MKKYEKNLHEVKANGYSVINDPYGSEFCNEVIDFMDKYSESDVELGYQGTERRIWDSQLKSAPIMEFKKYADELLSEMYGKKIESYTILALKNVPIPSDGSQKLGRWHIDSFKEQVKVFTFLSDIEEKNGPFEFLPGSHRMGFKIKNVFKGNYFSLKDFLHKKRKYQSLEEGFINETIKTNPPHPMICKAGTTAVIDTSAIHRARPCLEGGRYYLAAYYKHF